MFSRKFLQNQKMEMKKKETKFKIGLITILSFKKHLLSHKNNILLLK